MAPELKLEGVTYRVWRGPQLRSYGEAREASLRRDSSQLAASDLVAFLPRDPVNGAPVPPVRVTAPTGEGVLQDRTFHASGGVTLARGEDVARTPTARFEPGPNGGTVRGEERVEVTGRGYRLTGVGFTLQAGSGDLDVGGPARLDAGLAAGVGASR